MFKKLLLLILSTLQLHGMQQCPIQTSGIKTQEIVKPLDPQSTIIAFDLDEVVLTGREAGYTKWAKEHPQFGKAIEEVKKTYKLSDAHAIINKAVEEHPEMKELGEEFKKVIITAPQIQGTSDIIHALAKKGYGIIAASNMTESTYKSMIDNKVLPVEFTKEFYFVATSSGYEKPFIEYYQNLLKYIESKYPGKFKTVIFTDDKEANAKGAAATNKIKAIHFLNPAQFKQELQKLGVAIE